LSLNNQYQSAAKQRQKGAYTTQLKYQQTMVAIVDDLKHMRQLPKSWALLTENTVTQLIQYWLNHKNSLPTIKNKLTVLKNAFAQMGVPTAWPKNSHVLAHVPKPVAKQSTFSPDSVQLVRYETTRTILEFELYFGLTKTESIKLQLPTLETSNHGYSTHLVVDRLTAYNRCVRYVPIITELQKEALARRKALLNTHSSLTQVYSYAELSALYSAEIGMAKMKGSPRGEYIKQRYQQLRQSTDEKQCLKLLSQETGFSSSYKLRRYV
jgi:hypothetical protein